MCLRMRTGIIMNRNYGEDGYRETIDIGLNGLRRLDGRAIGTRGYTQEDIDGLKKEIDTADAILIGAGAGLSTSAGLVYSGERFEKYFFDFEEKYHIHDMYSGTFYLMEEKEEVLWAFLARTIYINRYTKAPKPAYDELLKLVRDKDYFVITTNVDHQFQMAGFDKKRLFYTQGDYGLFQSEEEDNRNTYENEEWVYKALEAEGFIKDEAGRYQIPADKNLKTEIPSELIPVCPDGSKAKMNLRGDDSFVEDEGWHEASSRYAQFLIEHQGQHILYLELGVGNNTPVIIKYPFWQMTLKNEKAVYACLNYGEAIAPIELRNQAILLDGDIGEILRQL